MTGEQRPPSAAGWASTSEKHSTLGVGPGRWEASENIDDDVDEVVDVIDEIVEVCLEEGDEVFDVLDDEVREDELLLVLVGFLVELDLLELDLLELDLLELDLLELDLLELDLLELDLLELDLVLIELRVKVFDDREEVWLFEDVELRELEVDVDLD